MKIKRIEPIAVSFPMKKPVFMAGVEIRQADNVLVRLEADNGVVGWGEAASAPTMTGETVESMMAAASYLAPALLGRPADDIAGAATAMTGRMYGNNAAKARDRDRAARSGRPRHQSAGPCAARRQAKEPHRAPRRHQQRRARRRPARRRRQEGRRLPRVQDQGRHRQADGRRRAHAPGLRAARAGPADLVRRQPGLERRARPCNMPARSPAAGSRSSSSRCWPTTSPAWRRSPPRPIARSAPTRASTASRTSAATTSARRRAASASRRIKLGGMRGVMAAGALCDQLGMAVNVSCKTGKSSIACAAGVHIAAALPQIDMGADALQRGLGRRRDCAPDPDRARPRGGVRSPRARHRRRRGPRPPLSARRGGAAGGMKANGMKQTNIGIGVVGAGRIGTLRARLAAKHPSVSFLAISDRDPARARALGGAAGADLHTGSNDEVISRPGRHRGDRLDARAGAHARRSCEALQARQAGAGREADRVLARRRRPILETLRETKGDLRVGYSRRYKECFLRAKEQMLHGRLGKVVGGTARVYNSRAQAFAILKRDPHAHPGARRADLLRRPDVLVPGGQPAGRGGGARPARHLQGGRLRRPRRDLGDRDVRGRRGDQSRRELRAAGALSDARPVRPRRAARHAKAP